eukprot:TRINITY_DN11761_c0_g1_i2.p1 TRINITY_DN11761_c0_g1~~TRINITY_DN11761_c0_g1_i2.p1  ORF type:complete len:395 (-),score=149.87 TRINITY_DN11761_c0_g1_i2:526-1710(-)
MGINNLNFFSARKLRLKMEIEKGKRSVLDGKYEMIRSLGSGAHSKVKLGLSLANNQQYAVKILKDLYNKFITNEIETLGKLKHPNMVNMIEFLPNVEYVKKDGTVKKVTAIVLELASGGEIFEFLFNTGRFSDPVSRYYFHQLIDTLEYIHSQGITHRDLKPENLLFDSSFTLKVADFGFSTAVAGRDGKGILNSYLGTKGYMAPEIVLKTGYSGTAVDLFAAGVILFIMYTGTPPFSEANPNDPYYKLIVSGKLDYFWYAHSRNKEPNFFSAEFKDLMSSMFSFDAAARPKVADIKAHRWFTGPVPTTAQVVEEMERRYSKVLEAAEKEREAKRREAEKKKAAAGRGILMGYPKTRGSLGEAIDTSEIEDLFPNLHLQRKIATYQVKSLFLPL